MTEKSRPTEESTATWHGRYLARWGDETHFTRLSPTPCRGSPAMPARQSSVSMTGHTRWRSPIYSVKQPKHRPPQLVKSSSRCPRASSRSTVTDTFRSVFPTKDRQRVRRPQQMNSSTDTGRSRTEPTTTIEAKNGGVTPHCLPDQTTGTAIVSANSPTGDISTV
jgi:hypothetical protein